MKTLKHGLDRFLAFVCIVDFIVMVLLTVYQVVVRYVFKSPSSVSEVLTRYCFVWLILLSATYVFGQRDHICITYLKDKLNGSTKRLLDAAIEVVIILFSALILVYVYRSSGCPGNGRSSGFITGSRCAHRCGNRTFFRSFHDLHAAIQCSVCNIRTENFRRFQLILTDRDPVFHSCRKHYE